MNEDKVEYVFDQHSSQPPQVISMPQERYDQAIAEARTAENVACENIAKEYITYGLESPTDGDLIAARIRERRQPNGVL